MRYGYDLRDTRDREMYLKMKKRELERVNNKELNLQQAYTEYLKDSFMERDYFIQREKEEQAAAAEMEKEIQEQIEKQLPQVLESALDSLLKDFK